MYRSDGCCIGLLAATQVGGPFFVGLVAGEITDKFPAGHFGLAHTQGHDGTLELSDFMQVDPRRCHNGVVLFGRQFKKFKKFAQLGQIFLCGIVLAPVTGD